MLEEIAEVVEVQSGSLLVSSSRLSACQGCQAGDNCSQRSLVDLFGSKKVLLKVENPEKHPVQVGQMVVLGLHEQALLKSSAIMYLIPLLLLIVTSLLASHLNLAEGFIISMGLLGLLVGFLWARKLSAKLLSNPDYFPKLIRIA